MILGRFRPGTPDGGFRRWTVGLVGRDFLAKQVYFGAVSTNPSAMGWISAQLPMLRDELIELAHINSGSFNAAGVGAMATRMRALFAPLEAEQSSIEPLSPYQDISDSGAPVQRAIGPAFQARKRSDAPLQIFLGGHLDTVFAADSGFDRTELLSSEDRLRGPGVADLKGGLLVMWAALMALEQSPHRERIGWEVLLNPDEEIGSASSAALLEQCARRCDLGLVFEPSLPDGGLAAARKGSGLFSFVVRGRAAHAGRDFSQGRNAVVAAARLAHELDHLNGKREGLTVNVGRISGGGPVNIVPDTCVLRLNVRTLRLSDQAWVESQFENIQRQVGDALPDGLSIERTGRFTRPPKPFDAGNRALAGLLQSCARSLEMELDFSDTGGCCDGNNLHAAGLPNIDNLGVVGGDIHSDREWMHIPSLASRAQLSASLLLGLASGELEWRKGS